MLDNTILTIKDLFGVEFLDYEREGRAIVITSGAGIGMAIMDAYPEARYFLDIDHHRQDWVDWESLAVVLCRGRPSRIILAGWFTIDKPTIFLKIYSVISKMHPGAVFLYVGAVSLSLGAFLQTLDDNTHPNPVE